MTIDNLYARAVFFVADAERSLQFYVEQLGFTEDWCYKEDGRAYVFQVSLFGFELILNQAHDETDSRAGHGRVFIGLEGDQIERVRQHIAAHDIRAERRDWGQPTLVIRDLDANEIFLWDWPSPETLALESTQSTAKQQR